MGNEETIKAFVSPSFSLVGVTTLTVAGHSGAAVSDDHSTFGRFQGLFIRLKVDPSLIL